MVFFMRYLPELFDLFLHVLYFQGPIVGAEHRYRKPLFIKQVWNGGIVKAEPHGYRHLYFLSHTPQQFLLPPWP